MAIKQYVTLVSRIQPTVTNCPPPAIIVALQQTGKELCRNGWAWREDLTAINVVALTSEYAVAPTETTARVTTIFDVRYNNTLLGFREWRTLITQRPDYPNILTPGTPTIWSRRTSLVINLLAVPSVSLVGGLKVYVAQEPMNNALGIEQRVMDDYEEELIFGTLHRLLAMPEKSWSNVKLAEFYGRKFRNSVMQIKARINKGLSTHSKSVNIPRVV